jgi:hypothetical protein
MMVLNQMPHLSPLALSAGKWMIEDYSVLMKSERILLALLASST